MRRLLIVICVSISLVSVATRLFAQEAGKIAVVDLSRAFDEYQKTKDFDKTLEKRGDVKQQQREDLVKDIRKMRDELELMNESARGEKEKDIEAKIQQLQQFDQEAKTDLVKERDDMVRDILTEMNEVIKEYGKANSYSIILNDRVLLYGEKSLDVTDDIIKILNENYKK